MLLREFQVSSKSFDLKQRTVQNLKRITMANKQQLEQTPSLLIEDVLAFLGSHEVIDDNETYEDYMDSFTEDDPF